MLDEFKKFALRGNAIDLAVGIIIGAAFNGIVTSLVKDIVTPPIGWLLGRVDFSDLYINLTSENFDSLAAAKQAGAATINYGMFINALISFVITAWVLFILVKVINKLKEQERDEPQKTNNTPEDIALLREIRDSLKK
ncbi:MAG: large conductance mechanosensitive channel protein MscL [Candidatus Pacebacteria bacterium]|nr:large conductance mechanosensitive channel protein MscL [Candidatus Paceibacterota bacterium]